MHKCLILFLLLVGVNQVHAQESLSCAASPPLSLEAALQGNLLRLVMETPAQPIPTDTSALLVYTDRGDEVCKAGKKDARLFHGKRGANFMLGFSFGLFGLIGTLAGNPKPEHGRKTFMSTPNRELMTDPTYRKCYKREARNMAFESAAEGWIMWLIIAVITIGNP